MEHFRSLAEFARIKPARALSYSPLNINRLSFLFNFPMVWIPISSISRVGNTIFAVAKPTFYDVQ